jgi:hypothetical protein
VIGLRRTERLRARRPDPDKIEEIRAALEGALISVTAELPVFAGVRVIRTRTTGTAAVREWPITGIDKGVLVSPAMSPSNTGLVEVLVNAFKSWLADDVRRQFNVRDRPVVRIAESRYPVGYWRRVNELARDIGGEAVLVVPFEPIGRNISEWLYGRPENRPSGLRVEWRAGRRSGGGTEYDATVEGIEVYMDRLEANRSMLFGRTSLRSIVHSPLQSGHLVDIDFVRRRKSEAIRLRR